MANTNDTKAHAQTYDGFIGMLKWALPLLAILVLVILIVIS